MLFIEVSLFWIWLIKVFFRANTNIYLKTTNGTLGLLVERVPFMCKFVTSIIAIFKNLSLFIHEGRLVHISKKKKELLYYTIPITPSNFLRMSCTKK